MDSNEMIPPKSDNHKFGKLIGQSVNKTMSYDVVEKEWKNNEDDILLTKEKKVKMTKARNAV